MQPLAISRLTDEQVTALLGDEDLFRAWQLEHIHQCADPKAGVAHFMANFASHKPRASAAASRVSSGTSPDWS